MRPHLSRAPEWVLPPLSIYVVTCVSADIPAVWIKARIPVSLKETETYFSHCGMRGRSVHRSCWGSPRASMSSSRPLPMMVCRSTYCWAVGVRGCSVTIRQVCTVLHSQKYFKTDLVCNSSRFSWSSGMAFFLLLCEVLCTVPLATYMSVFVFPLDIVICNYDAIRDRQKNVINYYIYVLQQDTQCGLNEYDLIST